MKSPRKGVSVRAGENGKGLTVHSQEDGITTLGLVESLSLAFVRRGVLPLHRQDGEGLAICGQQHALMEHEGEIIGEPVDGNVGVLGVAVEGHLFSLFYSNGLADQNGGPGQQFCTGRKREEAEAETQTEEDQTKCSHRGTQRDWTGIAKRRMRSRPRLRC